MIETSSIQPAEQLSFQERPNYPVPQLKLLVPTQEEVTELVSYDLNHQERKKNFDDAEQVIMNCRSIGLGDAIMSARYALLLAKKTNKKIICVVPPVLLGLVKSLKFVNTNLSSQ
jgi:hypothetical protein